MLHSLYFAYFQPLEKNEGESFEVKDSSMKFDRRLLEIAWDGIWVCGGEGLGFNGGLEVEDDEQ